MIDKLNLSFRGFSTQEFANNSSVAAFLNLHDKDPVCHELHTLTGKISPPHTGSASHGVRKVKGHRGSTAAPLTADIQTRLLPASFVRRNNETPFTEKAQIKTLAAETLGTDDLDLPPSPSLSFDSLDDDHFDGLLEEVTASISRLSISNKSMPAQQKVIPTQIPISVFEIMFLLQGLCI